MQRAYAMQRGWGGMNGFRKQIVRHLPQRIRSGNPPRNLDAARTKSIAMMGADKTATQQ